MNCPPSNLPRLSVSVHFGKYARWYAKRESASDTDIEELLDQIIDENLEALEELANSEEE